MPAEEPRPELPAHLSPSKKRRRPRKEATPPLPTLALEEYLELFMDKLSMWQLMATLDEQDAERKRAKGKQKAVDERDWMQMFCEHIVEPRSVIITPGNRAPHTCADTIPTQIQVQATRALQAPPLEGVPRVAFH